MGTRRASTIIAAMSAAAVALVGFGVPGSAAQVAGRGAASSLAESATQARAARAVRSTATVSILRAPVGQSGASSTRRHPATVTVRPAKPGRVVRLERKVGTRWKQVATARQGRTARLDMSTPEIARGRTDTFRVVALARGGAQRAVSRPVRVTAPQLTFVDDFGGTALDPAKWRSRSQPYGGSRECAKPAADRVRVSGGHAVLSVKQVQPKGSTHVLGGVPPRTVTCANGIYDNASITTDRGAGAGGFTRQRYATFAARIAFQQSDGMNGAFWLQGVGSDAAEIDVMEYYGVDGRKTSPATIKVHARNSAGQLETATKDGIIPLMRGRTMTDFNVYSVQWSPSGYVFRINGHVVWTTNKPRVSKAQQEIILSLFTSDSDAGARTESSTMKVDWVRAWK